MKVKQKKGQGFLGIWMVILIAIFVNSLLYIVLDDLVVNQFLDFAIHSNSSEAQDVLNNLVIPIWNWYPWAFGVGCLLFGMFMSGTYRERGSGIM